jgi:hypothetical protein
LSPEKLRVPSDPQLTFDDLEKSYGGTVREVRSLKPFTLVQDRQPRVELVHDDAKTAAVRAAVTVVVRRVRGTRLAVEFRGSAPPVDLAFAARLVWEEADYDLGAVILHASANERFTSSIDLGPDLREVPDGVDIILAPDPVAAEYTVDVKRIWADVLFFDNVPVGGPKSP